MLEDKLRAAYEGIKLSKWDANSKFLIIIELKETLPSSLEVFDSKTRAATETNTSGIIISKQVLQNGEKA
jgi:hypothetical protein